MEGVDMEVRDRDDEHSLTYGTRRFPELNITGRCGAFAVF
jgi:hypothetical protein